jgi:NAD(P)H-flavin reductase
MTRVVLEPTPDVAPSFTSPGQYVEVRAQGETGYFVLAGIPGELPWELFMRSGGGVSDVLLPAPLGLDVEVTAAIGDGFPMDAVRGRRLVIALSGTGVAAGRPLVRHRIGEGDAPRTHVWLGVRTLAELPLAADIDGWRAAGVPVVVCLSQPGAAPAGEHFAQGYVQDVMAARIPAGSLADARVFAVGVASMVEALRALAPRLGLTSENVHTNHG